MRITWAQRIFCFVLMGTSLVSFALRANNYYWIGGSGNWSDTLHWQSENNDIPGPDDVAIFNSLSFPSAGQIVAMDIEAYCLNLDFSQVSNYPDFIGNLPLNIFGSFVLSDKIIWDFSGILNFKSSLSIQAINTKNHLLNSEIYFNGGGSWKLQNIFSTTEAIHLDQGLLDMNGKIIHSTSFYALSDFNKTLVLSNSIFEVKGINGHWEVDKSLTIIADNSIVRLSNNNFNAQFTFKGGGLSYDKVILGNSTDIFDSNTMNDLVLSAGNIYRFQGGQTQSLLGQLMARGCSAMIEITSFGTGNAVFTKSNDDIQISFVSLKNITAEMGGGSQFIAQYSLDEGNNINCLITLESREMYWVNGTGLWTDSAHWSSPGIGLDGHCIPLAVDNLYFDDNSFVGQDTVTVDKNVISCHHMTWSGVDEPVFTSLYNDGQLNVYGSLTFKTGMENQFLGTVAFLDSVGSQSIVTANIPFNGDVAFRGSGGWLVFDSLFINGNLNYYSGTINIPGKYMSCNTFHSDSAYFRSLTFADTRVEILSANPHPAWSVNATNLQFDPGMSTIKFKANSSQMDNHEGDTIYFNDVIFEGKLGTATLNTKSTIYAKFRKLEFMGNGRIFGENTIDSLALHPGNYLSLAGGKVQTIKKAIFPTGICAGPILMNSINIGQQAILATDMDTLHLEFTAIQDIATQGDAVFWALNSNDLGNNAGWDTIQMSAPGNLYWVGGTGYWSEPEHWSLISGGVGGACIPTPMDNVYFDENSFAANDQVVTIDQNNAFARDMDWTGAMYVPSLDGKYSGAYMRIYGSLTFIPEMQFDYPAFITFESRETNKTIQTAGIPFHHINNNVYFYGLGGQWDLLNALDVGLSKVNQNSIYYYYGMLTTNGYPVSCYNFYSTSSGERTLDMDTSFVHVQKDWNIRGVGLNILPSNSVIQIDSGKFTHFYGNSIFYNKVLMNSDDIAQSAEFSHADSLNFNSIRFLADGELFGTASSVIAHRVDFEKSGKVNVSFQTNNAVFNVDSMLFSGVGEIYGMDTVISMQFDSSGLVVGEGLYGYCNFQQDGQIFGTNLFDTLFCTAGYSYVLQEDNTQTIIDSLHILGNNCQYVYLSSSGNSPAGIFKETGSVFGDFIQMQNINATGLALFDAGNFSKNIDNSNTGWLFHDNPTQYSLGNDTSFLAGDSIQLCASNFNGGAGSTYEWINMLTGEIIGTDSCIVLTEVGQVILNVYYNESPACVKSDTIELNCLLGNSLASSNISCYELTDGQIIVELQEQTDPVIYKWYDGNNNLIANTKDLINVPADSYSYQFLDAKECLATGNAILSQPDALALDIQSAPSCFDSDNGSIQLNPSGGTLPYTLLWSDGNTSALRDSLVPGIYSISFTDAHNCPSIDEDIIIEELDAIQFSLESVDLNCYQDSSGSISVLNLSGGTGNYIHVLWARNGQAYDSTLNIDSLFSGDYTLSITDDNACFATQEVTIVEPDEMIPDLTVSYDHQGLGFVDVSVSGGVPPYAYLWDDGATGTQIGPLPGGDHAVNITDAHGCFQQSNIFVEVGFQVFAPTAFSPNGDGANDTFHLMSVGNNHKFFELRIFDRFGMEVFNTTDENGSWNGRINNNGRNCPMEVYTWVAEITFKTGQQVVEKGNVSLLR